MARREPDATTPTRRASTRARKPPANAGFYQQALTGEELDALRVANADSLRDEIALLRVLVRRALEENATSEQVRRLIHELGQALRVERSLATSAANPLTRALADLLEEVGRDEALASGAAGAGDA